MTDVVVSRFKVSGACYDETAALVFASGKIESARTDGTLPILRGNGGAQGHRPHHISQVS
jgi:hypothetical protein